MKNKCLVCGKEFNAWRPQSVYCSRKCRSIASHQGNKQRHEYMIYLLRKNNLYKCELCEHTKNLHLHHKNGIKLDSNKENLQLVCPSCHTNIHHPKDGI